MTKNLTHDEALYRSLGNWKIMKDRRLKDGHILNDEGHIVGKNASTGELAPDKQATTSLGNNIVNQGGGLYSFEDIPNLTASEEDKLTASAVSGSLSIGVNLAGAEFGSHIIPGIHGTDYIYPTTANADYYIDKGNTILRIPFLWERIQPTLSGDLDVDELDRLHTLADHITGRGVVALLDVHNYGYRRINNVGRSMSYPEWDTVHTDFADLWTKLANEFTDPLAHYGLMNEPHGIKVKPWGALTKTAIKAIRDTGATNKIYAGGVAWSGAHSFVSSGWADFAQSLDNSSDDLILEVHQYADSNNSGTGPTAKAESSFVDRIKNVTLWARAYGFKLHLGEFNTGDRSTIVVGDKEYNALVNLFDYLRANADVWVSATMWAGGPWWGNYMFSTEPNGDVDDIRYTKFLEVGSM